MMFKIFFFFFVSKQKILYNIFTTTALWRIHNKKTRFSRVFLLHNDLLFLQSTKQKIIIIKKFVLHNNMYSHYVRTIIIIFIIAGIYATDARRCRHIIENREITFRVKLQSHLLGLFFFIYNNNNSCYGQLAF